MIDYITMKANDEMALLGFSGKPMPDACYTNELLAAAWRAGRNQSIDKGLIKETSSSTKSIKIKHCDRVRVNFNRIEDCY